MNDTGIFLTEKEAREVYLSIMDLIEEGRPIGKIEFSILIKTTPNLEDVIAHMEEHSSSSGVVERFKNYANRS